MRILITAGPTREPIDTVRFVSNRSSGRLGVALSYAGADAGHEVTLLLGPVPVHAHVAKYCDLYRFETCAQLECLLGKHFPDCHLLIMAAAVADYRPTQQLGKLTRDGAMDLHLEPTPDLVATVTSGKRLDQKVIAFALAQSEQLEARAMEKMRRKGVDAMVANPLQTMEADVIEPLWLTASGQRQEPGQMSKELFAHWLIDQGERLLT